MTPLRNDRLADEQGITGLILQNGGYVAHGSIIAHAARQRPGQIHDSPRRDIVGTQGVVRNDRSFAPIADLNNIDPTLWQ